MALKSLLKIAQDEQNVEKQKELLGKILEIDQKDFKSISSLISIARKEGNLKLEKDLLKKILRIYPENVKALSSLALIARKERNSKEEKRILEKILELEPQNLKTLSSLSLIARKEKDIKAEKEILSKILQIDPKNVKAMSSLIRIARQEKNIEEESKLLHRQLEIDPDNRIVIKGLEEIGEEKDEDLFTRKHTGPVQNARTLIAKSDAKDMLNVISKIKELIENEDPTLKVLVQAEAATKAKLFKQAEGYLKAHKKISKDNANALKVLKKAFVIVQSKNKLYDELKWQEIYDEYERLIGITNCGETHPDEEGR